jgi:hypothetical protein
LPTPNGCEQAENNLVVELCLQQVRASRPFFPRLLGQRSGWRPTELPPTTVQQFPWLVESW